MYNLLDSHDTPRFLHCCGENKDKLKLAVAFQFLMPGAPAIYYGDEVGLTGDNDPDSRRAMVWEESEQDQELFAWYRRLSELRHQEPVIRYGNYKTILAEKDLKVFGFERSYQEVHMIVILNSSGETVVVDLPTGNEEYIKEIPLSGEQSNKSLSEDGDCFSIQLEPYSVKIIKNEEVKNYEQSKKNTGNHTISCYVPGSSHSL
jgi:glycosidase